MRPIKLIIKTKSQKYPIIIGNNLIERLSKIIKKNSIQFKKCLLVIDSNVPKKKISQIKKSLRNKKTFLHIIKASEKNKNLKNSNKIVNTLLKKNFSRDDCLISVGGGITGDLSGFAASLFKRGLKFINIPTTLLSQVDSSIGGKTGVNTLYGKNLIGSFYQPRLVISDSKFLNTLPKREITCGYGEILKHSLISDKNFFKFLNKNFMNIINLKSPFIEKAVYKSCKIKKYIVEKDEKEQNIRKVLNFGHTFAHSYEATLGYSKKLNHGEAVLLGMITALKFSLKKHLLNKKEFNLIKRHFENSKIPHDIKNYFSVKNLDKILKFMTKDKKNTSDTINLILLNKIGSAKINYYYNQSDIKKFLKNELIN
tara:strand:+ start:2817 stop:3923 length:1107 start_codon:yes stop_codon:yes gene_type:complete